MHEGMTRGTLAKRLAALMSCEYGGEYDCLAQYPGRVYFVPSTTLVELKQAAQLGIKGEDDLFGGVVPYPFVATKAITHPLVGTGSAAPDGWSHEFGERVRDAVLL